MKEVHIRQPIWNGDRSQIFVGIAHKRLLNTKGQISSGAIRVWIDYHESHRLAFPYPFQLSCKKIADYPTQILNDYNHTVLYIVPLDAFREVKNYRSGSSRGRSITQDEFKRLKDATLLIAQQQREEELRKQEMNRVEQGRLI